MKEEAKQEGRNKSCAMDDGSSERNFKKTKRQEEQRQERIQNGPALDPEVHAQLYDVYNCIYRYIVHAHDSSQYQNCGNCISRSS